MARRTAHAWIGTLMLVGLILLAYGLDGHAAMWGNWAGGYRP